ncbi:MAG: choice-of-anchor M domain-containing protein [Corynebacterium sp.]|uniref:choice-of-anchor M domain-containing protein n=1 Tax=Corynebacterium sp. TaxID=1720 RepID=UPI0026DB11DA|nr:choice-of-anchor M domain-containing protein [Corynebacterium sp.]MDO5097221.1 choice-of-anchor M domain-containing protein [Corynebacterium sp.]
MTALHKPRTVVALGFSLGLILSPTAAVYATDHAVGGGESAPIANEAIGGNTPAQPPVGTDDDVAIPAPPLEGVQPGTPETGAQAPGLQTPGTQPAPNETPLPDVESAPNPATAAEPTQVLTVTAPAETATDTFIIKESHQDIHLQLVDGYPHVKMRDDGSQSASGKSAYRPSGSAYILVDHQSEKTLKRGELAADTDLPDSSYVMPENQIPGVPWVGFSTVGLTGDHVAGPENVLLSIAKAEIPDGGRMLLWTESGLDAEPQLRLDTDDLAKEWEFGLKSHVHTGYAFTEPGRYDITFQYAGEFHGVNCEKTTPVTYTVTFLVGEEFFSQAPADAREQGTPADHETDFSHGFRKPQSNGNCDGKSGPGRSRKSGGGDGLTAKPIDDALKKIDQELQKLGKAPSGDTKTTTNAGTGGASTKSTQSPSQATPTTTPTGSTATTATATTATGTTSGVQFMSAPGRSVVASAPKPAAAPGAGAKTATDPAPTAAKPADNGPVASDAEPVVAAAEPTTAFAALGDETATETEVKATANVLDNMGMSHGFALGVGLTALIAGFFSLHLSRRM